MGKYMVILSVIILGLTLIMMKFFVIGKVNGGTGSAILMVWVGLSILTAVFSEKGKLKTIILGLYGILIVGFVTISILFAVSHM